MRAVLGHAVHAMTHVMHETGRHEPGRTWLDQVTEPEVAGAHGR